MRTCTHEFTAIIVNPHRDRLCLQCGAVQHPKTHQWVDCKTVMGLRHDIATKNAAISALLATLNPETISLARDMGNAALKP